MRRHVIERIAGERKLNLQVLRIFMNKSVPLRRGAKLLVGGKILEEIRACRGQLIARQELRDDRETIPQQAFLMFLSDAHIAKPPSPRRTPPAAWQSRGRSI